VGAEREQAAGSGRLQDEASLGWRLVPAGAVRQRAPAADGAGGRQRGWQGPGTTCRTITRGRACRGAMTAWPVRRHRAAAVPGTGAAERARPDPAAARSAWPAPRAIIASTPSTTRGGPGRSRPVTAYSQRKPYASSPKRSKIAESARHAGLASCWETAARSGSSGAVRQRWRKRGRIPATSSRRPVSSAGRAAQCVRGLAGAGCRRRAWGSAVRGTGSQSCGCGQSGCWKV
jgi:hypothetical protein